MIIKVFDITGKYAVDQTQGQRLYNEIANHLKNGAVTLDFDGVGVITALFFKKDCRELPIPSWVGMKGKSIKRFDAAQIDNNLSGLPLILFVLN